ncbi:MAG: chalcone isomerase family protein [Pseudobdellovibrio sp.]
MNRFLKLNLILTVILATLAFSNSAFAKKSDKTKATVEEKAAPAAVAPPETTGPITYKMETVASTEKFEDAIILKSRSLIAGSQTTELKAVSIGLRKKAVFGLVPVRVYVAQLLAANPEKLIKTEDGIKSSLKTAGPVQLRLTFLRDLPGPKISESFKEGLEANGIKSKNLTAELTQVMNEISAINEFKKGDSFSITGTWTATSSTILLESTTEIKVITGSIDLADHIFSIWFGKAADGKLEDLKRALIK